MILFLAWSLALLAGLVAAARAATDGTVRWAAAGVAASLATILVLAVQTDAYGVPWLAYCVWWLGGALVRTAPVSALVRAPAARRTAGEPA
jgi:hypothetical protein